MRFRIPVSHKRNVIEKLMEKSYNKFNNTITDTANLYKA